IDEATIRFEFATDVSRKHRNVTTGVKTLATFLVLRGLRVAIVAHPDSRAKRSWISGHTWPSSNTRPTKRCSDDRRAHRADRRLRGEGGRTYLISRKGPSSAAFNTVARRLNADGLVDNLGLADQWIARASERERAALFSEIATALLKV